MQIGAWFSACLLVEEAMGRILLLWRMAFHFLCGRLSRLRDCGRSSNGPFVDLAILHDHQQVVFVEQYVGVR